MITSIVPGKRTAAAALFLTLALCPSNSLHAAIQGGPEETNAVARKSKLDTQYYEAEQSYQEMLKVGKKRYAEKLEKKAVRLNAMESRLEERERAVYIQPRDTSTLAEAGLPEGTGYSVPAFIAGLVAIGLCYAKFRPKTASIGRRTQGAGAGGRFTLD